MFTFQSLPFYEWWQLGNACKRSSPSTFCKDLLDLIFSLDILNGNLWRYTTGIPKTMTHHFNREGARRSSPAII